MKTPSILVVEDREDFREIFKEILADSGYSCETANSVKDATEKLQNNSFNVAILDIRLDDGDVTNEGGIEILKWMEKTHIDTKVIICTAYSTKTFVTYSSLSRVIGYLLKQEFSPSDIVSTINKAMVEDSLY